MAGKFHGEITYAMLDGDLQHWNSQERDTIEDARKETEDKLQKLSSEGPDFLDGALYTGPEYIETLENP